MHHSQVSLAGQVMSEVRENQCCVRGVNESNKMHAVLLTRCVTQTDRQGDAR